MPLEEYKAMLKKQNAGVARATKAVIVGAGPVGVELAAVSQVSSLILVMTRFCLPLLLF